MLEFDDDFELLDTLLITQKPNTDNICSLCFRPFENICYDCGLFYDVPEYEVHDLYNYNKKPLICYQKVTHFREVLSNFQGRECKVIPDVVLSLIKSHVKDDIQSINHYIIKTVLKKNRYTKYVENVNSILFTLTGKVPPFIPKEIELKLIQYFKQIVKVFDNCKTSNRINFLNYYYIIYKLLESMNQVDILKHVPRLKSKHRILEHDKIWRRVCTQLEWEFIKTRAPCHQIGY